MVICLALLGTTLSCAREERSPAPTTLAATAAAGRLGPGDYVETIVSGGVSRQYRLHVPTSYRPETPVPLVLNLHGYNSNAAQQESVSQFSAKADRAGFVAAYPEGLGNPQSWRFGDRAEGQADVDFILDLMRSLESRLSIDPARVYVSGISNGAEMSYRLMCDAADTFAAAGLVSGGYPAWRDCTPARPVPVVAFHGTADRLLPYEGQPPVFLPVHDWAAQWAARNGCAATPAVTFRQDEVTGETWSGCRSGADVVLYTIAGKGHSWPGSSMPASITTQVIDATDVMWEFFAAHPR
jgi:polyhydroxybutyrate depolymerase